MLGEARGFALLTRRVRKDHQELRRLRRPSRHLVRDKAEGKINLTPRDHTWKAYKHWMTRVAQKRQTAFRMHPSWQGRAVHEAPLESRLDEAQEFLDTKKKRDEHGGRRRESRSVCSPRLKVSKVCAHLVTTALFRPRLD